jgi:hypothetical protein
MVYKDFFARIAAKNLSGLGMDRMVIDEEPARLTTALKFLKGPDLALRRLMDV